jgi:signal peptidase
MSGRLRPIGLLLGWALLSFVATVGVTVLGAIATGHPVLTVRSGSMEPAIGTGDVVIVTRVRAEELRIGDVVTFRDPARVGVLITHRVRGIRAMDHQLQVETRGDANTGSEQWVIGRDGTVGRVVVTLPGLGYLLAWSRGTAGRIVTVAIPALVLALLTLHRIWRPRETCDAVVT